MFLKDWEERQKKGGEGNMTFSQHLSIDRNLARLQLPCKPFQVAWR